MLPRSPVTDAPFLGVPNRHTGLAGRPVVRPILSEDPAFCIVPEVCRQDYREETFFEGGILNRKEHFYSPVKISRHQVGTAEEYFVFSTVPEVVQPGMLKEPPHNGADPDVVAHPFFSRTEAAYPPYLEDDLNPGLGGTVQGSDTLPVDKSIQLEDDAAIPVTAVPLCLPPDAGEDPGSDGDRRHQQFPE